VRIGIALLLTSFAVAGTQAALGRDVRAGQPQALLTFALPSGGICAVRADGSRGLRLTPRWRLSGVTWAPNGRYVAFVRATASSRTPSKISVADARGRIRWRFNSGRIDAPRGSIDAPLWAPDGRYIAYVTTSLSGYGSWLVVARPTGSELHMLLDNGTPGWGLRDPAWSPDGQRIAFVHSMNRFNVYSVRFDGSNRQLLAENAVRPAYSPDGTKLAYAGSGAGNGGVFVANADGSDPQRVSSRVVEFNGHGPSWSPDGKRLVFASFTSPEVVVASADGSGERVIADLGSRWVWSAPQWSPDGKLVAFVQKESEDSARPFRSSIVVARTDGRGWRVIVRDRHATRDLHSLAWRRAVPLPTARRAPCPRR
jgi:Tol biopolymer transport system component